MSGLTPTETDGPAPMPKPGSILLGDAELRLRDLPDDCVDTVVTSPPYFRLRDYGVTGQLGLEDHVDTWVGSLRRIFRQVDRVLTPTGTVWLNIGDTYATHPSQGAPRKSLVGAPERLLLALIDDGWTVRNKIVWAKRNHTPSSVRDRLANSYEVIYLLSRQPQYYFDLHAVRVPHLTAPPIKPRSGRPGSSRPPGRRPDRPAWLGPNSDHDAGLATMRARGLVGHPLGKNPGDVWQHSTSTYRGAHFATYPVELVTRMLLAGCPEQVCITCRAPHQRAVRRIGAGAVRLALEPTCSHDSNTTPGLVLDPFLGSGTTAVAAESLDRNWLGIELNQHFVSLARARLRESRAQRGDAGSPPRGEAT